jgi:hypothetical protein
VAQSTSIRSGLSAGSRESAEKRGNQGGASEIRARDEAIESRDARVGGEREEAHHIWPSGSFRARSWCE